MRRCTRHIRRSDRRIKCAICGRQIHPGEEYRRRVLVNDDVWDELYNLSFAAHNAHEDCAMSDGCWQLTDSKRPPIHKPKAKIVWTPDSWNDRYPVGTVVDFFPIAGLPDCQRTRTRSKAWDVCGHTSVLVEGVAGGVSVEHLAVIP